MGQGLLPLVHTADQALSLLQTKWKALLDPLLKSNSPSGVPTGTIFPFAGRTVPQGYLLCDGSQVPVSLYQALANTLQPNNPWGTGTNSTFKLPDLRGRVLVGAGQGSGLTTRKLGATGGEETHLLTTAEIPAHTHPGAGGNNFIYGGNSGIVAASSGSGAATWGVNANTGSQGGGGTHNNMQPFAVVNYIIKT